MPPQDFSRLRTATAPREAFESPQQGRNSSYRVSRLLLHEIPSRVVSNNIKCIHHHYAYLVCLDAFVALSNGNLKEAFPVLQNFVIKLYSPSRMYENLVACRRALFTKYSRQIDDLPPTIDSLLQHTRRAALQAQIWRQAFQTKQILPLAIDWSWTQENGKWVPVWRTIPVAAESCNAFVSLSSHDRPYSRHFYHSDGEYT
ncbi:putative ABC transporter ATP-binding protein YwjA [Frankliniella fusca]|uniref:ABC transporter ATP-binding protein YwjA n=1 Tax=Frankliniella fusca TaxID=407009 RepID=A0AAE1LLR3_9NEOP|nr:putative ABC transporter ATP-binding protein YwjA [Frankliniella fusca]